MWHFPDPNLQDFVLCSYLKSVIYETPVNDKEDHLVRIMASFTHHVEAKPLNIPLESRLDEPTLPKSYMSKKFLALQNKRMFVLISFYRPFKDDGMSLGHSVYCCFISIIIYRYIFKF